MKQADFLVIGSGIAGLSFALKAARLGSVRVVTKGTGGETNTWYAQGGIAAVADPADSYELHITDTLRCGAGLCRPEIVEMVVTDGPARVRELIDLGVQFSSEGGRLSLGREGGHSVNRIVHSRDMTGREIQRRLLDEVRRNDRIELLENHMAVGAIQARHLKSEAHGDGRVYGAYVLDVAGGIVEGYAARVTVLATGGAGKVYLYTSNPDVATGDGLAMAYRAGARVANMEFVQFHPTCLYHPKAKSFLLSEALRGEGGVLRNQEGRAFMPDYHPDADLAPRDVVARAIDREIKTAGAECVFLDMTHLRARRVRSRFPNLYEQCLEFGFDMTRDPLPVVPATHYFCGGVDVDAWGRSSLPGLFALGEVSHTGLHGANRLASNSLLEGVVYAQRAATLLEQQPDLWSEPAPEPRPWKEIHTDSPMQSVILEHDWDEARRVMWDYVGIVRDDHRLEIALRRMRELKGTVEALYWCSSVSQDLLELRNIILVGELVIRCAQQRKESRGLHYTESYPRTADGSPQDTLLVYETRVGGADGVV